MKKVLNATKKDLQVQSKVLHKEIVQLSADLRKEMHEQGEVLRKEIAQQGVDLRKEMALQGLQLRKEMHEQGEVLRKEIAQQGVDLRKEMAMQGMQLRKEMHEQRDELVEAIQMLAQQMDRRFNEVYLILDQMNKMLTKMHEEYVSLIHNYNNHDQRIEHLEHAVFPAQ